MIKKKKRVGQKKILIIVLSLVIIIMAVLGIDHFRVTKTNRSNVLREIMPTDLTTQDLSLMDDVYAWVVAGNSQEGLLSRTAKGSMAAGLAKNWSHSKDGLTWTFHLRKGLKWSNGDSLTAADFVYAWRRTVNPKTASQYAYVYSGIKNADQINSGKNKDLASLGIKAIDQTTLVVTLAHPMPQFENLMALPVFFAQDKKFEAPLGKKVGTSSANQVYDGPYKFVGWNGTNKKFRLVPNPHYWNPKALKNSGVDFQVITDPTASLAVFNKGQLDQTNLTTPEQIKKYQSSKDFKVYNNCRSDFIEYNQTGQVPALNNVKIRQALNLATDRRAIVQETSDNLNTVATGLTPVGLAKTPSGGDFAKAAAKKTDYVYNMAKAKKLFAQGLKEAGLSKLTLSVEGRSDAAASKLILDTLQQSWQELPGLTIRENLVPLKQWLQDLSNQNFQVSLSDWTGDYDEPLTFLNMFMSTSPSNDGRYASKVFNRLIANASDKHALDDQARTNDEIDAEQTLYKDAAINPIDWTSSAVLANPKIKGVQYFTSGVVYYYAKAYFIK
ncbi:peptide ABC transporter substrate-binding protein [Oenococcus sp.]|uniref:peptide ABC transporter substrate-binding protein n=1 Tax=Oenococcus sp. TaxID=1979414 RepID=UPI0039EB5B1E